MSLTKKQQWWRRHIKRQQYSWHVLQLVGPDGPVELPKVARFLGTEMIDPLIWPPFRKDAIVAGVVVDGTEFLAFPFAEVQVSEVNIAWAPVDPT